MSPPRRGPRAEDLIRDAGLDPQLLVDLVRLPERGALNGNYYGICW